MKNDDKKPKNYLEIKKDLELITKLSEICDKYNCSFQEMVMKLKEIKGRGERDEGQEVDR